MLGNQRHEPKATEAYEAAVNAPSGSEIITILSCLLSLFHFLNDSLHVHLVRIVFPLMQQFVEEIFLLNESTIPISSGRHRLSLTEPRPPAA